MPRSKPDVFGWLLLAVIIGTLLFELVAHPIGTVVGVGVLALLAVMLERQQPKQAVVIRRERENEDIGSFARRFDRRGTDPLDPWAIRAVWNALVPLTESEGRFTPLRPTDRFTEDLNIDLDDLEELVPRLVEQCERRCGNWKANPFYDKLATVGGLVHFISAQPSRRSG